VVVNCRDFGGDSAVSELRFQEFTVGSTIAVGGAACDLDRGTAMHAPSPTGSCANHCTEQAAFSKPPPTRMAQTD
jgi:hypothetical protein